MVQQIKMSFLVAILLIPVSGVAADDPATHRVQPQPFKKSVELVGYWSSNVTHEIKLDVKQFTDLKVKEIAASGSTVKKGDLILQLQSEEYEQVLAQKGQEYLVAKATFDEAELQHKLATANLDLDRQNHERRLLQTEQDFQHYMEVLYPQRIESTKRSLKSAREYLEDQRAELRQLERMYQEDDLTEESEELVLQRTRRSVEQSEYFFSINEKNTERELQVIIPRELTAAKAQNERDNLAIRSAIQGVETQRQKIAAEFEKARGDFGRVQTDWQELQEDGKQLAIQAMHPGRIYYGKVERGMWTGTRKYQIGDAVANRTVVMTLVGDGKLRLHAVAEEAMLPLLTEGQACAVIADRFPNQPMNGKITTLSEFPADDGKYEIVVSIDQSQPGILPGQKATVHTLGYTRQDALCVPKEAVFTDDHMEHYLFVKSGDSHKRVVVKPGWSDDKFTELLSGLSAGDEVLLKRPEPSDK